MKVVTIGRGSNNDIKIDRDITVSRTHCQIIQDDNGGFCLADFGSKNGTFVNGRKISGEVNLRLTDVVRIGNTTLPWKTYFKSLSVSELIYDDDLDDPDYYVAPQPPAPEQPLPRPLIEVPANININQRNENFNAEVMKKGDDFQVPFKRNMGDKMGNAVGSTLGCVVSVLIIVAILFIVGLIISSAS